MLETYYTSATTEDFEEHTNPGTFPVFHENSTQHQITTAKEQHKRELRLFKEQSYVERCLKNQTINAFDEIYLLDIRDDHDQYHYPRNIRASA